MSGEQKKEKISNYDWCKQHSIDEIGHYLCWMYDIYQNGGCEHCPVERLCSPGFNGFIAWLKEDYGQIYKGLD